MAGRAHVVAKAREGELARPRAASRLVPALEHEDRRAALRQRHGGREAVGSGADDDRVGVRHVVLTAWRSTVEKQQQRRRERRV